METAAEPSRIGRLDLARARTLLSEARNELSPRHSRLLEQKLAEAERAFERFNRVASASGKAAEVARGAQGAAAARRTNALRGLVRPRATGPLLILLALLWPAPTADSAHDHAPGWLDARMELEDKLRELSLAAQQVQAELAAEDQAPDLEAAKRNRPPKPNKVRVEDDNWQPAPGEPPDPPCIYTGASEPGLQPGWVRCTYRCGKYLVELNDVWGDSAKDCLKSVHFERARREAANRARVQDKER